MKCDECLQLIESFFDNELDGRTSDLISSHVAECSSCSDAYQSLQSEQEFYLSGYSDVEVSPFFWTKVNAEVESEKTRSPLRGFVNLFASFGLNTATVAAFCLFIFAIGASAIWLIQSSETSADDIKAVDVQLPKYEISNTRPQEVNESEQLANKRPKSIKTVSRKSHRNRDSIPDGIARNAEKEYLRAIAILSNDLSKRREGFAPEVKEQFEKTLAVVDSTIKSTRRAVRENPDDPVAVQYMLSAYSQKVDVLKELVNY